MSKHLQNKNYSGQIVTPNLTITKSILAMTLRNATRRTLPLRRAGVAALLGL